MKNKEIKIIGLLFAVAFMFATLASAFGVSSEYWAENPLKLAPGESDTVTLGLQNMIGGEDISLTAQVSSDGDIAEIVEPVELYFIPFEGGSGVSIKVNVPSDAKVGDMYKVVLSMKQVSQEQGGTISLSTGVTSSFPVEVVAKSESSLRTEEERTSESVVSATGFNLFAILIVVGVLVAAALVTFFFVRIRNRDAKKGRK